MTLTVGMVTTDSTDPASLARWWAEQTGGSITEENDGWFVIVSGTPLLAFQRIDDPTPGKNRVHLDLTTDDLDGETDRLLAAGATLVARHGEPGGFQWATLADPQGNQFCISGQH